VPGCGFTCGTTTTLNPNRLPFSRHALRLLGWLSEKSSTSSFGPSCSPLDTRLFPSLVLRVMTISSGVTRSASARRRRASSFDFVSVVRVSGDGLASYARVFRSSASITGSDVGHKLAALMNPRSGGRRNRARTSRQNPSSGSRGVVGSGLLVSPSSRSGAVACATTRSGNSAADPVSASRRAKSRRDRSSMVSSGRVAITYCRSTRVASAATVHCVISRGRLAGYADVPADHRTESHTSHP